MMLLRMSPGPNPLQGFQVDRGLRATSIPFFSNPVAGLPMVHW
jgi:hypothetical protein